MLFQKTMKSDFDEKLIFGQSWKYSDSVGNIRTPLEIFGQLLGVVLSEYFPQTRRNQTLQQKKTFHF